MNLNSILPDYVKEKYPLFVEYLEGYYEWLSTKGPSADINKHLSRKTLAESNEAYTKYLFDMLLNGVPQNVFSSKEVAIQWSKKIHSAKGSKNSIKFLFKLLYGEDIDIFLPKTNLFRLSAGKWVSEERLIYISVPNDIDLNNTNIRYLKQTKAVSGETEVSVVADVQRVQTVYFNKMILSEMYIKSSGDFDITKPVYTQDNIELKIVPSTIAIDIIDGGINYQLGDRIYSTISDSYDVVYEAISDGFVKTDINNFLSKYEIEVILNNSALAPDNYRYENNIIYSDLIEQGDLIEIKYPASQGLFTVSKIDSNGSIEELSILSSSIGYSQDFSITETDAAGTGCDIVINVGVDRTIQGRYLDTVGRLSANSYLHDSNYYQNYSYVIRTQQDIGSYSDILLNTVHPSGMKFFGSITILLYVQNLLKMVDLQIDIKNIVNVVHDYGLGPRYSDIDKFKNFADNKFYPVSAFENMNVSLFYSDTKLDYRLIELGLLAGIAGSASSTKYVDSTIFFPDDYIEYTGYSEYCDTEYIRL